MALNALGERERDILMLYFCRGATIKTLGSAIRDAATPGPRSARQRDAEAPAPSRAQSLRDIYEQGDYQAAAPVLFSRL